MEKRINVDVYVSDEVAGIVPIDGDSVSSFAYNVLTSNGIDSCSVNIVFINDTVIAEMNVQYRQKEGATDVLAFILSEEGDDTLEGEVYVSLERAKAQAAEFGVPFSEETMRLVTHGLLHLTGMTHDTVEDHDTMTATTEKLVDEFFGRGA